MLLYWLWLHLLEDLTSGQKRALLAYFHDPEQLYRATESAYRTAVQLPEEGYSALSDKDLAKARALAAECRQKRIGIVAIGDSGYPARLRHIPDAPVVLYYRGRLPNWEMPSDTVDALMTSSLDISSAASWHFSIMETSLPL